MKEIEVKAHLKNREQVMDNLRALGCQFSDPISQNDKIFFPLGFELGKNVKRGINVLRIRKTNDQIIFTLKQSQSNELACIEKELLIDNDKEMEEIFKLLGFYEAVKVNKMRLKCKYKNYEVCVDKVEGLGDFIEVESITDEDEEKVQKELFDFLQSLGISPSDREMHGYDTLMYNKLKR